MKMQGQYGGDLARAIKELFNADNEIKIIGARHGEKLYETLLTREEMAHAEDLGGYYRIPSDNRDLNYNKYFIEGQPRITRMFTNGSKIKRNNIRGYSCHSWLKKSWL